MELSLSLLRMIIYVLLRLIAFSIIVTFFFFFNDTATTEIYTLSLHDALPILRITRNGDGIVGDAVITDYRNALPVEPRNETYRSEEHTSELQSHVNLVCRLLLEKKKKNIK